MNTLSALAAALLAVAPAAAQPAPRVSKPFVFVELRMAPFQGADAAATRRRAEAFLAGTGLKVIGYQDNEAVGSVGVRLPEEPVGGFPRIRWAIARMKLLHALRGTPKVSEVVEYANTDELGVRFSPAPYRPEASRLLSIVPSGTTITYHLNPNMHGLWVRLDATALADPRAAAQALAARYPAEIEKAEVMVEVEVMRVEMKP